MNYRFYYPDWNSRKDICEDYPEIKEITREPIAFWYGVGPKRTIQIRCNGYNQRKVPIKITYGW